MAFADLLINTCTVYRFTAGAQDEYGQPVKTWNVLHNGIDCRHVSGKGREIKVGAEVAIVYDEVFVNDIDVTEQDRVDIDGDTYEILSVVFRQNGVGGHHKVCYLERVK